MELWRFLGFFDPETVEEDMQILNRYVKKKMLIVISH